MPENTSLAQIVKTFAVPRDPADLIESKKHDLLGELDLGQLVRDLSSSADLLRVAKYGVADEGDLPGKITGISDGLVSAAMKAERTMWVFRDNSNSVLQSLSMALSMLSQAKEKSALNMIVGCEKYANRMETAANELADEFTKLADKTVEVTRDTQNRRGKKLEEMEAAEARISALREESVELSEKQEEYKRQNDKLDKMINQAREDQAIQDAMGMTTALIGGVTSAISAGIGAYASMKNPAKWVEALAPRPSGDDGQAKAVEKQQGVLDEKQKAADAKTKASSDAKEQYVTAQELTGKCKAALEKAQKDAAAAAKAEDKDKKAAADKAVTAAEAALKDAESKEAAAKRAFDTARTEAENAAKAAQAAAEALKKIAQAADEASQQAKERAAEASSLKQKLYDAKFKLMDKQSEAAGKLARYALEMKQIKSVQEISATTVKSLLQAVSAMLQVAATLRMAAQFWSALGLACKRLGDAQFKEYIKAVEDLSAEDRIAAYKNEIFVEQVVDYCGLWGALWVISNEYSVAVKETREKAIKFFQENPDRKTALGMLPQLAEDLEARANREELLIAQRQSELRQAKAVALNAAPSAA